jgi:predicted aspartyl protease
MKGSDRDMGLFRIECKVENVADEARFVVVPSMIVDTGSELTWIPGASLERIGVAPKKRIGFRIADGSAIERRVGYAVIRHETFQTVDEVVFGEPGDLSLLGARTLEGMNVRVEPTTKRLVSAGPIIAAACA